MSPVIQWILIIITAVVIAAIVNFVIILNCIVPTGSMAPTIKPGDRLFGSRLTYLLRDPRRGEIIVFRYPDDPKQKFIKRIIGCPGDTVEIIDGVTYVNGKKLREPYLKKRVVRKEYGPAVVPVNCYFVMGDNRNRSNDSRRWQNTFVPRSEILGRAMIIYWPLKRAGKLK